MPRSGERDGASTNERGGSAPPQESAPVRHGFLRRYRLPLALAVVAACLYAGSIVYIVLIRGQIGT